MSTFHNQFVFKNKNNEEEYLPVHSRKCYDLFQRLFKNQDYFNTEASYNFGSCAIYETKDGKYYNLYGSTQPQIVQKAIGMPLLEENLDHFSKLTFDEIWPLYQEKCLKYTAEELDHLSNDINGQAGVICYTSDEFKETEQYKATAHANLFETHFINDGTPAQWWDNQDDGTIERPLKGLKVLDLTRIVAAPVITRNLAEYGASVIRITSPNLPDLNIVHPDTNNGKWCVELDFHNEDDRKKLLDLMLESDVIVEGYRAFHLDKYGLGKENILRLAKERGRGIIYARENTYGWHGPWIERIGWQPISDSCCGVSRKFAEGLAEVSKDPNMKKDQEAIILVIANSDYCTGSAGATAVIQSIIERSKKGGSYVIDVALNYYSMWLVDHIGTYDNDVWFHLWKQTGQPKLRHYHHMRYSLALYGPLLKKYSPQLWNPNHFEKRSILNDNDEVKLYTLKPVVQFSDQVKPQFTISTRSNGSDAPFWPKDLTTNQITA